MIRIRSRELLCINWSRKKGREAGHSSEKTHNSQESLVEGAMDTHIQEGNLGNDVSQSKRKICSSLVTEAKKRYTQTQPAVVSLRRERGCPPGWCLLNSEKRERLDRSSSASVAQR